MTTSGSMKRMFAGMLAGTVLIPALVAQAELIAETKSYSVIPNATTNLDFSKYNGGLTVTQIVFTASITNSGYALEVHNPSASDGKIRSYAFGSENYTTIPGDPNHEETVSVNDSRNYGSAGYIIEPGQTVNFNGTTKVGTFTYYVPEADFNHFIGSGSFTVVNEATQYTSLAQEGGLTSVLSPGTTAGSVTVSFLTIPEPGTVSLVAMVFIGAAALRRRAMRKTED